MKYYYCMEQECESTFEAERARFCPCCGSRMIRHALWCEVDRLEETQRENGKIVELYAIGA